MDPERVTSPRDKWTLTEVVFNNGDWAVAIGEWEGDNSVGIRWNGTPFDAGFPARGQYGTWLILPDELADIVLEAVRAME